MKLTRTVAKADEYEEKYQTAMKTINQLKTGIQSIFTRIGCATTSADPMPKRWAGSILVWV